MTSQRQSRKRPGVFFGAMAVSLALVAGACGGGDSDSSDNTSGGGPATEAPQQTMAPAMDIVMGGTLVVGGEAEVTSPWTPQNMQCDSYCQMRARSVYDPLIVVDENLEWRPFLAESIEANADSTVFTITVRQGIKFHDGTDLNADAVIGNLQRGAKSLLLSAAVKDLARVEPGNIGSDLIIEKLDDFSFTIATGKDGNLSEPLPWPGFPYYFGGQWGLIASLSWLEAVEAGTAKPDEPVGSGPFTFVSYAPGDRFVVKKNPNYWLQDDQGNTLPYLDGIDFRVIPDSQVRATALLNGDLDLLSTSDAAVILDLESETGFSTLLQNQYGETNYILLHLTQPYLADKSVRCALLQAVDKIDIIDVIANGNADPANGLFSPGQEGYLEDNGSLEYDPEAATAAIAAYEAANGPLTINYSTTTAASSLATAQYLQDAWGQIGVNVTIDQIEQSKLINNALFGDAAFDAFGWRNHAGLYADQQFFWWHSSAALPDGQLALNFGRLSDPVIDENLELARSAATPAERKAAAEAVNRRFASECLVIPTSYTKWAVVSSAAVQGVGQTPQADGDGKLRDGAGFPGQIWLTAIFKAS